MAFGTTPVSTTSLGANQFPVSAVQEPGQTNLTALEGAAGSVDGNGNRTAPASMYVKTGNIVDLATLLTLSGTPTDANTINSFMGRLTKIRDLLNATLGVQTSDIVGTGSITAAQATQDTPVGSATIAITLGKGQTSWAVDLRGTFNAGTTINFDGTLNGTNWFSVNGVPLGSTSDTEVSSVVGGSALQYQGNASGLQQVRVRASALAGGDSVTATLIGSISSDGGFLTKALPPGAASIGAVTANAGTNLNTSALALEAGGHLAAVDTVQGAQADAAYTTGSGSVIAILKGIFTKLAGTLTISGTVTANPQTSATGTLSSVGAAVANTQLLASNVNRKGFSVFNDSTAIMYLAFNATASTTSYTVQVSANGFFEMPTFPIYTGQINAVWSAAAGSARITEIS